MIKVNLELTEAFNLAGLTEVQKQVVAMHLEGMRLKQMSQIRQVSESAIKQTIKAAREKYRTAFSTRSFVKGSLENGIYVRLDVNVLGRINNLSDEQREALNYIAEGHDIKNTAHRLSVSESAVKQRLKIAKKNLGKPEISRQGACLTYTAANSLINREHRKKAMTVRVFNPTQEPN